MEESINFVACHDGFTLNDVVSYNHKHNEENGEANRDGRDDTRTGTARVEGPTDDTAIEHAPRPAGEELLHYCHVGRRCAHVCYGR